MAARKKSRFEGKLKPLVSRESPLTDVQIEVFGLLHDNTDLSYAQAGAMMDPPRDRTSVRDSYLRACKKLGKKPERRGRTKKVAEVRRRKEVEENPLLASPALKSKKPRETAEEIGAELGLDVPAVLTNAQFEGLAAAAKEAGITGQKLKALLMRFEQGEKPITRELKDVQTSILSKKFRTLAVDSVDSITRADLEASSARDRALIAAIATDKALVLENKPTQIIQIDDRRKLNELVEAMVAEARRRRMDVKQTDEGVVDIDPREPGIWNDPMRKIEMEAGDGSE